MIHGGLHDRLQVDGYVLLRVGDHHLRERSNREGPETEIWFVTPTKWNQACISVQTFQKTGLMETTFDKGKLFSKELLISETGNVITRTVAQHSIPQRQVSVEGAAEEARETSLSPVLASAALSHTKE